MLLDFESTRLAHDDVHSQAFWSLVLFQTDSPDRLTVEEDAIKVMEQRGAVRHEFVTYKQIQSVGPHLVVDGQVIPVFRLYDDTARAFVASFRPADWTSPK